MTTRMIDRPIPAAGSFTAFQRKEAERYCKEMGFEKWRFMPDGSLALTGFVRWEANSNNVGLNVRVRGWSQFFFVLEALSDMEKNSRINARFAQAGLTTVEPGDLVRLSNGYAVVSYVDALGIHVYPVTDKMLKTIQRSEVSLVI